MRQVVIKISFDMATMVNQQQALMYTRSPTYLQKKIEQNNYRKLDEDSADLKR